MFWYRFWLCAGIRTGINTGIRIGIGVGMGIAVGIGNISQHLAANGSIWQHPASSALAASGIICGISAGSIWDPPAASGSIWVPPRSDQTPGAHESRKSINCYKTIYKTSVL